MTGDQVRATRDGHGRLTFQGIPATRTGPGAAFQTLTLGTEVYAIPVMARPYLGRLLDPRLFDVTALQAAGARDRIPVRISFSAGVPRVPGVTVTSRSAGAASGYLTAASARTFGAALAAQFVADAKAHFPARSTLFGATAITADLGAAPGVVTPKYPMRTLIIKVLGRDGRPLPEGFVNVQNADDASRFQGFGLVTDGETRVSVPLGHYVFDTGIAILDDAGNVTGVAVVTKSDYVVSGQNQTVTLDGSTATVPISVRTPRPAERAVAEFDVNRIDAAGQGFSSSGYAMFGPGTFWVAPAGRPAVGTLQSTVSWNFTAAPASGLPYAYALHFDRDGIPAGQTYRPSPRSLFTTRSRYFVDVQPRDGQEILMAVSPDLPFASGWSFPVRLPGSELEYVNAIPGAAWQAILFAPPDPEGNPFADEVDDGPRLAPAGGHRSTEWLRGPFLPNVPVATDGQALFGAIDCLACRTADSMGIALALATDSTPGHTLATFGNPDGTPVARFRLYRNGTLLDDEADTGSAVVPVPADAGTYRLVEDLDRGPSGALQSLTTRTELTFRSAAGQGGRLPRSWTCSIGSGCTVLPLLRASVKLPVDLVGSVPLGTSSIELRLGHVVGAPQPAITSGRVEIRRPGGNWTALPVIRAGNVYRACLRTSAADAGHSLDLRITGTDAAGGRLVQTVTAAFAVASS